MIPKAAGRLWQIVRGRNPTEAGLARSVWNARRPPCSSPRCGRVLNPISWRREPDPRGRRALDRIDRAPAGWRAPDRRSRAVAPAIEAAGTGAGRAETVQCLFSLDYDPGWMEQLGGPRQSAPGLRPPRRPLDPPRGSPLLPDRPDEVARPPLEKPPCPGMMGCSRVGRSPVEQADRDPGPSFTYGR